MLRRPAAAVSAVVLALWVNGSCAAAPFKIVTGPERGTQIQIGRDLARFVAPQADIDLEVLPSAGSADNVRRLRFEPGVKLAIVQSDVYQAFLDRASGGNVEAADLVRPLRVMMPLYQEDIHFVVRADSPLQYFHEIESARINVGPAASAAALTVATLYRAMFAVPLAEEKTSRLSNDDALVKLITDRSVDVVAIVAGQPAKLFLDMKPESKQYIRLLKFDRDHVSAFGALKTYVYTTVQAASYPNLLSEDIPALGVKAFLVTNDVDTASTQNQLVRLARALCSAYPTLRSRGHPIWREVDPASSWLGLGWSYYAPAEKELRGCTAAGSGRAITR